MTISRRSPLTVAVAVVATATVFAAPSVTPLPVSEPFASPTIELSAVSAELRLVVPRRNLDYVPTPADQVQRGAVPSSSAALPAPPIPVPAPVATDFAGAIKSTYSAIEPWVRYGFELATYAVGWVPYVGGLSGQIMIFYNFGERIVRSLVFNSADWLWGPLPFVQGLRNIAQDSWDALVQLGIDEWNFFLPPLPPLPLATQQTTTASPEVRGSLRERVGQPDRLSRKADDALSDAVPELVTPKESPLDADGPVVAPVSAVPEDTNDPTGVVLAEKPVDVTSSTDLTLTDSAGTQASSKAADPTALRHAAPDRSASAKRASPKLRSSDKTNSTDSDTSVHAGQSRKKSGNEPHSGVA